LYAVVSSLWGIAYLENLPFALSTAKMMSDLASMEEDVSMRNAWGQLKAPGYAEEYPEGSGEIQDFTDELMKDLGLRHDRKRLAAERAGKKGVFGVRAWYKEWFKPYQGLDYKGIVAEYLSILPED
jgi:dimethylaniline monooxygenase (N-oxide forming)